jgi:hypothetical protein
MESLLGAKIAWTKPPNALVSYTYLLSLQVSTPKVADETYPTRIYKQHASAAIRSEQMFVSSNINYNVYIYYILGVW